MWNKAQSRMDAYPSVVATLGGGGRTRGVTTDEFGNAFAPKFRICIKNQKDTVGICFSETV